MEGRLAVTRFFSISFIVFLFLMPIPALAKKWNIDYARSSIKFTGTLSGQEFTGAFKSFYMECTLDPQNLKDAALHVVIDMTSAATGDVQKDTALPQKEWFDSKTWKEADFKITELHKSGENSYAGTATLSIKGVLHDILFPFKLLPDRDATRLRADITLNRHDFNVGEGAWASDQYVGKDVKVAVDVVMF